MIEFNDTPPCFGTHGQATSGFTASRDLIIHCWDWALQTVKIRMFDNTLIIVELIEENDSDSVIQ